VWGEGYKTVRELIVHPEASEVMRKQVTENASSGGGGSSSSSGGQRSNHTKFQSGVSFAKKSLSALRNRRDFLDNLVGPEALKDLKETMASVVLAEKVRAFRETVPILANPFAEAGVNEADAKRVMDLEAELIHKHYCWSCQEGEGHQLNDCPREKRGNLRVIRERDKYGIPYGRQFIRESIKEVVDYFARDCHPGSMRNGSDALDFYISNTKLSSKKQEKGLENRTAEKDSLDKQIEKLSGIIKASSSGKGLDPIADKHGSKAAQLVRYLKENEGDKVIVFSMWHDTLRLIHQTLQKCEIKAAFCDGSSEEVQGALQNFTTSGGGGVNVILLSARARASGVNLQCADEAIIL
jgi:hypothetical protein